MYLGEMETLIYNMDKHMQMLVSTHQNSTTKIQKYESLVQIINSVVDELQDAMIDTDIVSMHDGITDETMQIPH